MASRAKSEEFMHHCSLCMESYHAGRVPKLLPCFHTFCMPCLEKLAAKAESSDAEVKNKDGADQEEDLEVSEDEKRQATDEASSEDGDDKEEATTEGDAEKPVGDRGKKTSAGKTKKLFQCPTCRNRVIIPPKGISALQTNFYLPLDLEAGGDRGSVLCDMCEDGHPEEANSFCQQCQQHMCRPCKRLHDRFKGTRDHHVEPLTPASATQRMAESSGFQTKKTCQFHPDQALCFHCSQCDVTICLHCKLTSHEGHDTKDMATAAVQAKGELSGLHDQADSQLQLLEACISRLERDEQDLARQKKETVQQARGRCELLVSWVTSALDEFLEEVSAQEQACLTEFRMKRASASFFRSSISSKKKQASRTMTLGPDLVVVKNELQGALLKDEALDEYRKLAERRDHLTFLRSTAEPSVLELDTVRAYMGVLAESSKDGPEDPNMTYPQLVAAVLRVEDDMQAMRDKAPKMKVAFHVTVPTHTNLGVGQHIIFSNVLCNEGSGYDISTGTFTAPVDGSYMFTTTVRCTSNGTGNSACLMVRSVEWGRMHHPESTTINCVVSLKKGEQVWVQPYSNFQCWGTCTLFSGVLISV